MALVSTREGKNSTVYLLTSFKIALTFISTEGRTKSWLSMRNDKQLRAMALPYWWGDEVVWDAVSSKVHTEQLQPGYSCKAAAQPPTQDLPWKSKHIPKLPATPPLLNLVHKPTPSATAPGSTHMSSAHPHSAENDSLALLFICLCFGIQRMHVSFEDTHGVSPEHSSEL